MLWDSCLEPDIRVVCRDERCDRDDIHPPHVIEETRRQANARQRLLGWVHDPFERRIKPARRNHTEQEPTHVLDSCVLEVCSYSVPKSMGMIQIDLEHVYGSGCIERRLHRSLSRLSNSGQLHRIDLREFHRGGDLNAYLLPGSRIRHDPRQIYETLTDRFEAGMGKRLAFEAW